MGFIVFFLFRIANSILTDQWEEEIWRFFFFEIVVFSDYYYYSPNAFFYIYYVGQRWRFTLKFLGGGLRKERRILPYLDSDFWFHFFFFSFYYVFVMSSASASRIEYQLTHPLPQPFRLETYLLESMLVEWSRRES